MENEKQQSEHGHCQKQHHHGGGELYVERMDPAQQQLARALRSSFRLLSVLMVFVLILFAVSEVTSINPDEVGIVTRFGKIQHVVEEGLTYAWPFMIGRVEKIDVSQKEIDINDFWMFEKPEDRTKTLLEREAPEGGLRPGYDGALLTGDQSLYHVRLKCVYKVKRTQDDEVHPAVLYKLNVKDDRELVRSAVCSAAIQMAARRTVDDLYRNRESFEVDVRKDAQKRLDKLRSGIEMTTVSVTEGTWPLQALADFAAADAARRRYKAVLDRAYAQAGRILRQPAGENFEKLVGAPLEHRKPTTRPRGPYDLIGKYERARRLAGGRDNEESEKILTQINEVLAELRTEGRAGKLIERARTQSTEFKEAAKRRAKRFSELLPKYNENPEFMLAAEWAKVLKTIFDSPTVEVVLVGAGNQKVNIQTKQNPDVANRIVRELSKIPEDASSRDNE